MRSANVKPTLPNAVVLVGIALAALLFLVPALTAQEILNLPATLSGNKISLDFEEDPVTFVRLKRIIHHEGGDFDFVNNWEVPNYPGLWEFRGEYVNQSSYDVGPSNAASFEAYQSMLVTGEVVFHFIWNDVVFGPTLPLNKVTVEVFVSLGDDDQVSHWRARITRDPASANTASIDEFDCPVVCLMGPVAKQDEETHRDAQWRARFLVPIASTMHFTAPNMPMGWYLKDEGSSKHVKHLCGHHTMQFAVLYHADPQHAAGFRRMVYAGTEDIAGYYKKDRYRFIPYNDEGYFYWAPTYYPVWATLDGAHSEFGNEFASTGGYSDYPDYYPAVLGALKAKGDDFWYDVAAYYRDRVEALKIAPSDTYELNGKLSQYARGPHLMSLPVLTSGKRPDPPLPDNQTLPERWLQLTHIWRKMLENDHTDIESTYMHFNFYRSDGKIGIPDLPVLQNTLEDVKETFAEARLEKIRGSVRTLPKGVFKESEINWYNWMLLTAPQIELFDRNGQPSGGLDFANINYAVEEAEDWYPDNPNREIVKEIGLTGLYMDYISGVGPFLHYKHPGFPQYPNYQHGGCAFTEGKNEMVENVRIMLNEEAAGLPGIGKDVYMASEATEELVAGSLEFIGWGYDYVPRHLLLLEEYLIQKDPATFPPNAHGVPSASRDWCPPLWSTVYHQYQPGQALSIPLTNIALKTNPKNQGGYGMEDEEFLELMAYFHAAFFLAGAEPTAFLYYSEADYPMVLLDGSGTLITHKPYDPTGVGLEAAAAIRDLYASLKRDFAGKYVLYGRMQRPLYVDLAYAEKKTNPTYHCTKVNPAYQKYVSPPLEQAAGQDAWANLKYFVTKVQHSVWQSPDPEGEIGLLFYNWTCEPATFHAEFDPALNGLEEGNSYTVQRLELDGSGPPPEGPFTGPIDISFANFAPGSEYLDAPIPPQTLVVLEVVKQ